MKVLPLLNAKFVSFISCYRQWGGNDIITNKNKNRSVNPWRQKSFSSQVKYVKYVQRFRCACFYLFPAFQLTDCLFQMYTGSRPPPWNRSFARGWSRVQLSVNLYGKRGTLGNCQHRITTKRLKETPTSQFNFCPMIKSIHLHIIEEGESWSWFWFCGDSDWPQDSKNSISVMQI